MLIVKGVFNIFT